MMLTSKSSSHSADDPETFVGMEGTTVDLVWHQEYCERSDGLEFTGLTAVELSNDLEHQLIIHSL